MRRRSLDDEANVPRIPVVIIRGLDYERCECGYHDRVKTKSEDLGRILKHIMKETRRVLGLRNVFRTILEILFG